MVTSGSPQPTWWCPRTNITLASCILYTVYGYNAVLSFSDLATFMSQPSPCRIFFKIQLVLIQHRGNKWADSPEGSYSLSCAQHGGAEDLSRWHYCRVKATQPPDLSLLPPSVMHRKILSGSSWRSGKKKGCFYKCLYIFQTCFVHMYLFIMLLLQK